MPDTQRDLSDSAIFPRGDLLPPPFRKNFIGTAYLQMLVAGGNPWNCPIGNVTFEPGCRNNWHRHPGGQILLVTGGRGWYQEEGQEARELHAGDVVMVPAHIKHWHGAAKDSWLVHLSIETNCQAGPAEWLEPVADATYNRLK